MYDHPRRWVWICLATANFTIESNSSFICSRWQQAFSSQMLFGQCRVTEVVNHITAVSLSSKHRHKFLNCLVGVFLCMGNYRQTLQTKITCLCRWPQTWGHLQPAFRSFQQHHAALRSPNENICSCFTTIKALPTTPSHILRPFIPHWRVWEVKAKSSEPQGPSAFLPAHGHRSFLGWSQNTSEFPSGFNY